MSFWNPWRSSPPEDTKRPDMSTGDEAAQAIARGRDALAQAHVYRNETSKLAGEIRRELQINHFAEAIFESLRRKP